MRERDPEEGDGPGAWGWAGSGKGEGPTGGPGLQREVRGDAWAGEQRRQVGPGAQGERATRGVTRAVWGAGWTGGALALRRGRALLAAGAGPSAGPRGKGAGPGERDGPRERERSG